MKNKLSDLNNHLFAQLERLGDEDLTGDDLVAEIDRARAVKDISAQVVSNAQTMLKATEIALEYGVEGASAKMPLLLEE